MLPNPTPSLRRKIAVGFYVLATAIALVAAAMWAELRYLEQRFSQGEGAFRLAEHVLEMRRFEKNYLLYGEQRDFERGVAHVRAVQTLLGGERALLEEVVGARRLASLEREMAAYREELRALAALRATPDADAAAVARAETRIRELGQSLTATFERLAGEERRLLHGSVQSSIQVTLLVTLVLAAAAITVGSLLSRRVAETLRGLERHIAAMANAPFRPLTMASREREVVSLVQTFNRMLAALEAHERRLVQSEKLASLGTMLSGVAHELNNPVSNISSSCQILLEEMDEDDPELRARLLRRIDEQTQRARNIIRTLLNFSRGHPEEQETVALARLVDDTVPLLRAQIPAGVNLAIDIPPELRLRINKQKIQQMLVNLVANSLDALAGRGEIHLGARALAADDGEGPRVEIRVRDNGPGIPEALRSRIFDPFFTTKDVGEGSGLGLFVVHGIVEEHDGRIRVESAPGRGTEFIVELPAATDEEAPHE